MLGMFTGVEEPQQRPHFHAVFEDGKAVFGLDPIASVVGSEVRDASPIGWLTKRCRPTSGAPWLRLL